MNWFAQMHSNFHTPSNQKLFTDSLLVLLQFFSSVDVRNRLWPNTKKILSSHTNCWLWCIQWMIYMDRICESVRACVFGWLHAIELTMLTTKPSFLFGNAICNSTCDKCVGFRSHSVCECVFALVTCVQCPFNFISHLQRYTCFYNTMCISQSQSIFDFPFGSNC